MASLAYDKQAANWKPSEELLVQRSFAKSNALYECELWNITYCDPKKKCFFFLTNVL